MLHKLCCFVILHAESASHFRLVFCAVAVLDVGHTKLNVNNEYVEMVLNMEVSHVFRGTA